jgi:hypothetical protein
LLRRSRLLRSTKSGSMVSGFVACSGPTASCRPPTATDGCAGVWHGALSDRARVAFRFAIGAGGRDSRRICRRSQALKTNEAVADLCVVMPRHALAGRKGQHLQCKRATAPITRSPATSWSPRTPICAWRTVLRLAYQNAIYHGSGYSKGAGDVRNLHSRPERRANEICCSFRNLLNPSDLVIADGRSLAL